MTETEKHNQGGGYMSATEAARELGISRPTLYSYVSRGLLRSEFADTRRRTRRYLAEDVQRLKERQEVRRDPQKVVDTALHWGMPVLSSALTLIEGGRFYYRGRDALDLAKNSAVEQAAALIWTGDPEQAGTLFSQAFSPLPPQLGTLGPLLREVAPMVRCQALLPLLAAEDVAAYDFRRAQAAFTGARILWRMTLLVSNRRDRAEDESIAGLLQRAWVPDQPRAESLFNTALILCADHELNVSSFTARCAASAGSTLYAVVSAGLAALQGVKHGGMSSRVEALFRETARPEQARTTIAHRLRRGERVPGFGHPLYPDGDPRCKLLLEQVRDAYPQSSGVQLGLALAEAAQSVLHEQPNIDFGLATLCAALDLPPDSALALFALGRTIGWIGHALEEYEADQLIRPRAHYTGILPHKPEGAKRS